MKIPHAALLLTALAFTACSPAPVPADALPPPAQLRFSAWDLPISAAAAQPDLVLTDAGVLLSWMESRDDGHALKFARYDDSGWSSPQEIARGDDWFVNWADTPHIAATLDGALWAHWLQKSAAATYAYDVALVRSADNGVTWSKPVLVNDDGTPTEHGFVSLWPAGDSTLGIAWLDGRDTGGGHAGHQDHAAAAGAMTLRVVEFGADLQRSGETRVDGMVCDCCQTDAAMSSRGALLVYRDRSAEEVRDIASTRQRSDGSWTTGRRVHADEWTMPACPVNGPSVAASGTEVVVGWYSAARDVPVVQLARSTDAGDRFAAPVTLDRGARVQGRIDVAMSDDAVWVLWLREEAQVQSLHLARFAPDLSRELQRIEVARLQGRGRGTGFPQLQVHTDQGGDQAYVVWTDVVDGAPRLQGARIALSANAASTRGPTLE